VEALAEEINGPDSPRVRESGNYSASRLASASHLAVGGDDILVAAQFGEGHWAASVEFVGTDTDLGTKAELSTVIEAGARIPEHDGAVHFVEKCSRHSFVVSHNGVSMMRAVAINMGDGFLEAGDSFDREDQVEILGVPVFLGGGLGARPVRQDLRVAANLDATDAQEFRELGVKRFCDGAIHQSVSTALQTAGFWHLPLRIICAAISKSAAQ
jgi:hypothetical protein